LALFRIDLGSVDHLPDLHFGIEIGKAVLGYGLKKVAHFRGRHLYALQDLASHAFHEKLIEQVFAKLLFDLVDGLAVVVLKLTHIAVHELQDAIDAGVELLLHFGIGHFNTVQFGLVENEFGGQEVVDDPAAGIFGQIPPLGLVQGVLFLYLAEQDELSAHYGNDLVYHHLLSLSGSNASQQQEYGHQPGCPWP